MCFGILKFYVIHLLNFNFCIIAHHFCACTLKRVSLTTKFGKKRGKKLSSSVINIIDFSEKKLIKSEKFIKEKLLQNVAQVLQICGTGDTKFKIAICITVGVFVICGTIYKTISLIFSFFSTLQAFF